MNRIIVMPRWSANLHKCHYWYHTVTYHLPEAFLLRFLLTVLRNLVLHCNLLWVVKSLSGKVLWLWSLIEVLRTGSILAYNENLPRHWLQSYGRSGEALCAQYSNNEMKCLNTIASFSWMCCWQLQILQFFQCFTCCNIGFNVTANEVRW